VADVEAGPLVPGKESQKCKSTSLEAEATSVEANAGPSVPKGKEKCGRKRKCTALEAVAGGDRFMRSTTQCQHVPLS
jgi:hypothetical protein